MNRISLLLLLLIFSNCAKEANCSNFKTGEFRYANKSITVKITRNDSIQIETNIKDGVVFTSTIEWVSDCKYILTFTNIENLPDDSSIYLGKKIYCNIEKIKGNRFEVHAVSTATDMNEMIEFVKVK
ncbi:MAG: hypothetical protein AAF611_14190 [Bacteroidota bacterium]